MTFRSILLVLSVLLFSAETASSQVLQIHTNDGIESFNLADIDSITFTAEQEDPQAGDEREFQLTDDVTITMVWIPEGEFEMGSPDNEQDRDNYEGPVHDVTFNYGFWIGKYEVTQAQWEAVTGENPAHGYGVSRNHPVYYVSWNDIQDFEEELTNLFRLPSESEWEYACRAGTDTRFYWGDDPRYIDIDDYAIYYLNDPDGTAEVGSKEPNSWNLNDMSGNVWELCEDNWHDSFEGAPDNGSAWLNQNRGDRIYRGGAYSINAWSCRSSKRRSISTSSPSRYIGFRLVRDAD